MGIFDKLFKKTEVNKCEICGEIIHSDFLTCSSCKKTSATTSEAPTFNVINPEEQIDLMQSIVNINGETVLAQWAEEVSKSLEEGINIFEFYMKYYFFQEFNSTSLDIDEEKSLFTRFKKDRVFRERLVMFFPNNTEFFHKTIIEAVGKELITNKNFENTNKIIESKRQGLWVTYYENGNLNELSDSQRVDFINHGIKPKKLQELVPAVIMSEGAYKDDKQEGLWKFYHKNGQLALSGEMINGKEDGLWKSYPENGRSYSQREYVDGQYVNYKEYFENGNLKLEFNYKDGKQHGINNEYYEDGSKNIISKYKEGKLHGLREQYYPSNSLEMRTTFSEGIKEGVHTYLDEHGEIIEQKVMKDGRDIMPELIKLVYDGGHIMQSLFTAESEKVEKWTMAQRMYDYVKNNNLNVESSEVSALNELLEEGKITKEFYDVTLDIFKKNNQ